MTINERIRYAQLTVDLILSTLLVVPFQVLLLITTIISSENPQTFTPNIGASSIPYLIGYFVLTIVYCTSVSLFYTPKRIVSPINVQVATGIAFSLILIFQMLTTTKLQSLLQTLTIVGNLTGTMFILTMVLVVVGVFQFGIVRWLVGLNFFGLDKKTYSINGDVETIDKILQEFLILRGYVRQLIGGEDIIYKRTTNDQVIISIGLDSKEKLNSTLATVAFHRGFYSIEKSERATELRDSAIFELSGRLNGHTPSLTVTENNSYNDPVSACVNNLANSYMPQKYQNQTHLNRD